MSMHAYIYVTISSSIKDNKQVKSSDIFYKPAHSLDSLVCSRLLIMLCSNIISDVKRKAAMET